MDCSVWLLLEYLAYIAAVYVLLTIHIVNVSEYTNKNTDVRDLDKFEIVSEHCSNPVVI